MRFLLDVNVLVAWGWSDHADHKRAAAWIGSMMTKSDATLASSAIPELGFVRVSVQRTGGLLSVVDATAALSGMLAMLGEMHAFLPDDQPSTGQWPEWCSSASRSTDAHLIMLAAKHGFHLATLDESIPGAFLIPKP